MVQIKDSDCSLEVLSEDEEDTKYAAAFQGLQSVKIP